MSKRLAWIALMALFASIGLSACRASVPNAAINTPTIEATIQPAALVTASPIPATATQVATATLPLPTPTTSPTATIPPQGYGPDNFPSNVNPLTGLPVANPALLDRRPLAVKVQIVPRGQRPPWGISLADLVYDYYQNNGSTRFHAIFYGNDAEQVGPIRSGRLLDISLVRMYKSIFAFGSADQRILNRMTSTEFSDRLFIEGGHNCPPLCRIDPNGFNFLVTNTAELSKYAVSKGVKNDRQTLNGMVFHPEAPQNGTPAQKVFVRFNFSDYNRWDYDANTGRYLRFQDTQDDKGQGEAYSPLIDKLNNQQISAANVVVLFVPHEYAVKTANSEIVDIKLKGSGTGYAFRDGNAYQIKWNRPNDDSMVTLTFADGTPYPQKPGNTWFQIFGQSSQATNQNGEWHLTFAFP